MENNDGHNGIEQRGNNNNMELASLKKQMK